MAVKRSHVRGFFETQVLPSLESQGTVVHGVKPHPVAQMWPKPTRGSRYLVYAPYGDAGDPGESPLEPTGGLAVLGLSRTSSSLGYAGAHRCPAGPLARNHPTGGSERRGDLSLRMLWRREACH